MVVAATEEVRQAFSSPAAVDVKPFSPRLVLPIGMRISQVAFSADGNFLVLSAESGGGLAVYEVQSLLQGNTRTAFEIATSGIALRALVPNPTPEKAELFAAVSANGELMVADLKARQFVTGAQGQILKTGVSQVSWSNKGKQLIAGLGEGSLYQLTPEGEGKGEVSRPPGVEENHFGKEIHFISLTRLLTLLVSSIQWLENEVFLVAHTPISSEEGMAPITAYHLITRHPKNNPPTHLYQKLSEPVPPFLVDRSPPYQFMQRLRNFQPNLDDVIVLASTASPDIGLITKSTTPLSNDGPAETIANVFTTTTIADDTRRAQLPMDEALGDTSPIGLAIDLSSKEKVEKPLPKEEYDASEGPLPAIMVLNNEGVLSAWWFIHAESIRQRTTYSGLTVAGGAQSQQQQSQRQASPFASAPSQAASGTSQNAFGSTSSPSSTAFGGALSAPSILGSGNASGPSFGTPSAMGKASTVFGGGPITPHNDQKSGPVFGQAGSGAATTNVQGTTFGMATALGGRSSSPWGAPSTGTAAASGISFGKSGFSAMKPNSFGSPVANSNPAAASSAFASFASSASPFMTAAPANESGNIFTKSTTSAPDDSGMDTETSFGIPLRQGAEAAKQSFGSGGFTLGSNFKKDDPSINGMQKPEEDTGGSMFGGGFGDALGAAQKTVMSPQSEDSDMGRDEAQNFPDEKESIGPAAKPAISEASFPQVNAPPKVGGLFGTQAQSKTTPAIIGSSQPTGFSINTSNQPSPSITMPDDQVQKRDEPQPSVETSPKIKQEPSSDDEAAIPPVSDQGITTPSRNRTSDAQRISKNAEPPIPPESTSKASFAPGDSSNSSKSSDDAPLPPDFLPAKTKLKQVDAISPAQASLPSDGGDSEHEEDTDQDAYDGEGEGTDRSSGNLDEEGSGVDVAQEISPSTDPNQSPEITPESSFGGPQDKTSPGALFGRITAPADRPKGKPPLFGEVGKTSAPYLPPPSKSQESPRSPSPVRSIALGDSLRPDNARSISAPGPFSALNNRKATQGRLAVPAKQQRSPDESRDRERQQQATNEAKTKKEQEQEQNLSDKEDERVREELASEVQGTLTLGQFIARQNYINGDSKQTIPDQIETLYRDINSMIDTLGLNARQLKAFTKGHEEMLRPGTRTRDDLEEGEWCFTEIRDLPKIQDDLRQQLYEHTNEQHAQERAHECRKMRREATMLPAKGAEIARAVAARKNKDEIASARNAPLSLDQATQQHDIRKKMAKFQTLLAEAEENVVVLRTKLASRDTSSSKSSLSKKPTVEAITNTIKKMTNIVKKKEDDIEALENQLRYLRFSSVGSLDSREGSPFHSASSRRTPSSKFRTSVNGYHHSPSRSSVLGQSSNGHNTPRKSVADYTSEEVQQYQEKARRRREINEIIRTEFGKTEPRIRKLE